MDSVFTLKDQNGNDVQFELLDMVHLDGEDYVVLLPLEEDNEDDEGKVVILRVGPSQGDLGNYVSVNDMEILKSVFSIFKDRCREKFNFEDEV